MSDAGLLYGARTEMMILAVGNLVVCSQCGAALQAVPGIRKTSPSGHLECD